MKVSVSAETEYSVKYSAETEYSAIFRYSALDKYLVVFAYQIRNYLIMENGCLWDKLSKYCMMLHCWLRKLSNAPDRLCLFTKKLFSGTGFWLEIIFFLKLEINIERVLVSVSVSVLVKLYHLFGYGFGIGTVPCK